MSSIRKVLWPTAFALGVLVFLGAFGQAGVVKTASAAGFGDICLVEGPRTLAVGSTALYAVRSKDSHSLGGAYAYDIHAATGTAKITSIVEFRFGSHSGHDAHQVINPTNSVGNVESEGFYFDGDIPEETSPDWADENFNDSVFQDLLTIYGYKPVLDVCGSSIRDAILEAIEQTIGCDLNNDNDCADSGETIAPATINALVAALLPLTRTAGAVDGCNDLGETAESEAIAAGFNFFVADSLNDWIAAACMGQQGLEEFCSDVGCNNDFGCTGQGQGGGQTGDGCSHDALFVDGWSFVDITCTKAGDFELEVHDELRPDNTITVLITCLGPGTALSISPTPNVLEIVPAAGSLSTALITVAAPTGAEVQFLTDRCAIETSLSDTKAELDLLTALYDAYRLSPSPTTANAILNAVSGISVDSTPQIDSTVAFDTSTATTGSATAAALLICNVVGATPGVANITATITSTGVDTILRATITVVGPAAFITATASPTAVRCDLGEKAQIVAKVTDAIGQPVSPHTKVEAVTNFGGVLGGTGILTNPNLGAGGQVAPISSTVAETDASGNATFFLLTSNTHLGAYDVLVTSGGGGSVASGGTFSTVPVSTQVTINCIVQAAAPPAPAPTVQAPRTGTGITPPNTGNAGLADASGGSSALFILGGFAAFALAGLATLRFAARR